MNQKIKKMITVILLVITMISVSNIAFAANKKEGADLKKDVMEEKEEVRTTLDAKKEADRKALEELDNAKAGHDSTSTPQSTSNGGSTTNGQTGSKIVGMFNDLKNEKDAEAGKNLIAKIVVPILNVVRIVATGVSIIMITYLGIKYMVAAPTEKANIKSQLITFTIGAVIVIGTVTILDIIQTTVRAIF